MIPCIVFCLSDISFFFSLLPLIRLLLFLIPIVNGATREVGIRSLFPYANCYEDAFGLITSSWHRRKHRGEIPYVRTSDYTSPPGWCRVQTVHQASARLAEDM